MKALLYLVPSLIFVNVESFVITGELEKLLGPRMDPEAELNMGSSTLNMIRRAGYPAEAHVIVTDDGYILTMHRIPGKPGSRPVLLQHCLFGSSADWVLRGKGEALAYLLADEGYDVWIANFRGNTYSKAHMSIKTNTHKFWDFSWHEAAIYDLPAEITYITNMKNDSIFFVGHSMGNTAFYVMAIYRPDISGKVITMYSYGPTAYTHYTKTPLRIFAPLGDILEPFLKLIMYGNFLPQNTLYKVVALLLCQLNVIQAYICKNFIFFAVGFNNEQLEASFLPLFMSHDPAGASFRMLNHYLQNLVSKRFCAYNFGRRENMKRYNSSTPPDYDLSKVTVPIVLFYGENDWESPPEAVHRMYDELPLATLYKVPYSKFNHVDFIVAKDVRTLVHEMLIDMIKDAESTYSNRTKVEKITGA